MDNIPDNTASDSTQENHRKAEELTTKQKKQIIYDIKEDDGNHGLPDAIPQGFRLTVGEVQAIVNDPKYEEKDEPGEGIFIDRKYTSDLAKPKFDEFFKWGIKADDIWVPGSGVESFKRAGDLDPHNAGTLLGFADAEIADAEEMTDLIPANYELTPLEMLGFLDDRHWPIHKEEAQQARKVITGAIENKIVGENDLLQSSQMEKDENDMTVDMTVHTTAEKRKLLRVIPGLRSKTALPLKLGENLPENKPMSIKAVYECTDPNMWDSESDKTLATKARATLNWLLPEHDRRSDTLIRRGERQIDLQDQHREFHQRVTPVIKDLIKTIKKTKTSYLHDGRTVAAQTAVSRINHEIEKYNKDQGYPIKHGYIDFIGLAQKWLALVIDDQDESIRMARKSLKTFCTQNQYPREWYLDQPRQKQIPPSPTSTTAPTTAPTTPTPARPKTWQTWQKQQTRHDPSNDTGLTVKMFGEKAIAVTPGRETRIFEFTPGYTPLGEKIQYRQWVGNTLWFIVQGQHGWRRATCKSVGDKLARQAAEQENVDFVKNKAEGIVYLKDRLQALGESLVGTIAYRVWFVACSPTNKDKVRMPQIVLGFESGDKDHQDSWQRVAILRGSLVDVIGSDMTDYLISLHTSPNGSVPLREPKSFGSQICLYCHRQGPGKPHKLEYSTIHNGT
ncbi:hypothetical protein BJX99DRAFT_265605 [Aspergillus californicus]